MKAKTFWILMGILVGALALMIATDLSFGTNSLWANVSYGFLAMSVTVTTLLFCFLGPPPEWAT